MTSKNLFLKLQLEDIKRRLWSLALSMLAFFLLFTVVCAMEVSNYSYRINRLGYNANFKDEWIYNQTMRFMGPRNEFIILITIGCAVVCGLSGFFYLHSKKKVDLYHSIPVRREKLFAITYLNGLLIYIVPYLINLFLCLIILGANRYMVSDVFLSAIATFGFNILYYSLIYTITIIAVMLTGNIVVSFLGSLVFYLYGSFVIAIKDVYFNQFFKSYFTIGDTENLILDMSPLGNYINTSINIMDGNGHAMIGRMISVLVATLVLIFAAVFLYKKRPSESAGKAMAFGISKPIIKLALVIPISLAGGILFMNISNSKDTAWLIFGLIFGLIVSYSIIEIIYNFDIRKAFQGKYYLLASAVIVGGIVCIFRFDLFQYDSYIPSKNDVKTMSVEIIGLDSNVRYYDIDNSSPGNRYNSNYELEHMKIRDYGSAYELAKIGIKNLNKTSNVNNEATVIYGSYSSFNTEETKYYCYKVKYTLDSGKKVYRQYMLPVNETYELLRDVYENLDYKKGHYPINQWEADQIDYISCSNLFEEKEFSLDASKKYQLLELYRSELNNLRLEDIAYSQQIATLSFHLNNYMIDYYVYPKFTNTIAFLQNHGFDSSRKVEANDIKEITIINHNMRYEDANIEKYGISYKQEMAIVTSEAKPTNMEGAETFNDTASIDKIFSSLVLSNYYHDNNIIIDVENSIEVMVTINLDDYGNYTTNYYYFRAGKVPEFVKKDIGFE